MKAAESFLAVILYLLRFRRFRRQKDSEQDLRLVVYMAGHFSVQRWVAHCTSVHYTSAKEPNLCIAAVSGILLFLQKSTSPEFSKKSFAKSTCVELTLR